MRHKERIGEFLPHFLLPVSLRSTDSIIFTITISFYVHLLPTTSSLSPPPPYSRKSHTFTCALRLTSHCSTATARSTTIFRSDFHPPFHRPHRYRHSPISMLRTFQNRTTIDLRLRSS